MAKSSLNFRYSDSYKSPFNKTQRRTSKIHQITNVAILDELIEYDVFTEWDWSEEDEASVFNISILDIYKKAELTDVIIVFLNECLNIFLMIQDIAMS